MFNRRLLIANSGDIPAVVTINFYLKCPDYQPGIIDLPVTFKISDFKTEELTYYAKVNSTVGVPVNLYAETVYEITVQDDRFLPILNIRRYCFSCECRLLNIT